MIIRLRRFLSARIREDFLPGDFVRRIGFVGTGLVESVEGGHAVVAWNKDRRDILPLGCLRQVRARGSRYDTRGGDDAP